MPKGKKTKIVATLGPASSSKEVIEKMMHAGVNVFRINFSHADHEDVAKRINIIRSLSEKHQTYTSILADLQGPKLRVGVIEEGAIVEPGDTVEFITTEPFVGNAKQAYMTYQRFPKDVTWILIANSIYNGFMFFNSFKSGVFITNMMLFKIRNDFWGDL